jgi:hypothetical protein
MLRYPPDQLRQHETTRTAGRDLFATAMLIVGAILNVGWIGLIILLLWRLVVFTR